MTCIECQKPARHARALDGTPLAELDMHCSSECAVASWERAQRLAAHVCVGELTTQDIDEKLSTTGLDVDALTGEQA